MYFQEYVRNQHVLNILIIHVNLFVYKIVAHLIAPYLLVSCFGFQKALAEHKVNRISFISKDSSDSRSFSYVVGGDDGKHVLYGIKTDKSVRR